MKRRNALSKVSFSFTITLFNWLVLYIVAALSATTFEFLVGKMMIRIFGELWWDYNEKPFNYKGIICLESTVAWGFYGLGIVFFLHGWVLQAIDRVPIQPLTVLSGINSIWL